ncbi:hypothetical protein IHQ71_04355 [Rhizobium sp. TH2]|uniref:hypothetical protein n=1 Tax=Rhizobium sp. TH2 TaxID=2775403 RepID=UPI002157091D|nr:hypothetical protein [Rhizobium sp. TH2]UVC09852.1 hypothetical protein IHQ71_04355 [Rhizobium sp. TH2]
MVGYIFGGEGLPKTPQELARLRAVAEALGGRRRTPQTVGEGIASIGDAILYRATMNKADKAEKSGIEAADTVGDDAISSLFGPRDQPDTNLSVTDAAPAVVPTIKSPQDAVDASPQQPLTRDLAARESYIRQAAQKRGVDPDIAVRVARSEGLAPGVWQSRVKKGDQYEPSYGDFQMLVGDGKTFPKGLGNDFQERTGLDPRDPKNANAMIDFALDHAKKDGWRAWYGAKKAGVNRWDGINANQVASLDAKVPASAMMPQQDQVPVVPVPDGFQQPDPMAQQQMQQPVEVAQNSDYFPPAPRKMVAAALSQGMSPDIMKATEALSNPFLSPGKKAIIQALIKRRFEEEDAARETQRQQADPKYQMDLEKGRLEIDKIKNPPKARRMTEQEEKEQGFDTTGVYEVMPDGSTKTVQEPKKRNSVTVNDRVIDADTKEVIADFSTPDADWEKLNDTTIYNKRTNEIKKLDGAPTSDFKDVTSLRKEIQDLPSYKNLSQALPIYQSMAETAGRNSKASDLNLVYGMGKIFDPTSVVREGEQVMVRNTASLPDWFQGVVASINGGATLTPETRKALMQEAYSRVKAYDGQFQNDSTQFKGIAARNKFNEADVIPTFNPYAPWQADASQADPATGQMPMDGTNATVMPLANSVPDGVDPEDWKFMTPEQRKLFQ